MVNAKEGRKQIRVVVRRMENRVDRLLSSQAMVGVVDRPPRSRKLDLDDDFVRDFLFAGIERERLALPLDPVFDGYVWDDGDHTHICAWLVTSPASRATRPSRARPFSLGGLAYIGFGTPRRIAIAFVITLLLPSPAMFVYRSMTKHDAPTPVAASADPIPAR